MAKTSAMQSGGYQIGRLVEQSGGMVDDVVYPTLLNDNEAHSLKNITLDEKGTVKTCKGRTKRFASAFSTSPVNGITAFYPDTTTSRLVFGTEEGKLWQDTPHLIDTWTDQADWQETGYHGANTDTTTTAGDVKVNTTKAAETFTRASVKYKKDGTQVASGVPSYEAGKFANGVHMEEAGAGNLLSANQAGVETDTSGFSVTDAGTTLSKDTTTYWQGLACLKTVTNGSVAIQGFITNGINASASTAYTGSVWLKGSGSVKCRLRDATNGITGTEVTVTLTSAWQRVTFGITTGALAVTNLQLQVFTPTAQAITFYADGLQIEQKAYATSWQLPGSSRVADSLYDTLPSPLPSEFFVSGFWKPDQASTIGRANNLFIAQLSFDDSNRYSLYFDPADDKLKLYKLYSGTAASLASAALTFAAGDIIAFAAAQLTQPYGDLAAGMHLWYSIAGGAVVHISSTDVNLPTAPTKVYVGCYATAGYECNGVIDALLVTDLAAELARGTAINDAWAQGFLTAAAAPTADAATLMLCQFDDALTAADIAGFVWISASKDISSAVDPVSGKVEYANTLPGSTSMSFLTRTSADGITWDAWTAIAGDGTINSVYHAYIQLGIVGVVSGTDKPSVQSATLSYDGTPAATELAIGFTAGSQFYFATLLSTLVITNKLDAPQKWTGTGATAVLGGTPPHGQYTATHKNYLFMAHTTANPSRLQFSDVLDLETWPALNFIDISPNDGDWITGLISFGDYLIITKNRSVWALVGTGTSDFEVRRIHVEIGCVAPRSLVRTGEVFTFVAHDGIYQSNLSTPVLISERQKTTWSELNRRRLTQGCAEFYDHKYRLDMPNGASTVNNLRIVYDTIRKALFLEEFAAHSTCYTKYVEAGQEILLAGMANEGQISQMDDGTTDAGAAIAMEWKTKHFNFGSSATEKKVRRLYLVVVPAASDVTLSVYLVVNNVEVATPLTAVVTGSANAEETTLKLVPRDVDVRKIRALGYRITQSTTNGGAAIHELLQEYMVKKVKAS